MRCKLKRGMKDFWKIDFYLRNLNQILQMRS